MFETLSSMSSSDINRENIIKKINKYFFPAPSEMKYIYLTSDKMKYRSIVARQTMFSETFPYFSFISFSITKSQHLESYL